MTFTRARLPELGLSELGLSELGFVGFEGFLG